MTSRTLPYMLLVACVTGAPTTSAQSNPRAATGSSGLTQETIDRLLKYESAVLDHFLQVLAPALRCDRAIGEFRQFCPDMVKNLQDEAQQATQDIARYRTSRPQTYSTPTCICRTC